MTSPIPPTAWALLLRGLMRNRWPMAASFALLSLWQVCETMVPVMIGVIIDRAVTTGEVRELVITGLGLVLLFTVLSYGYRFGARIGFGVVQREMHEVRVEIAAHALHRRGARSNLMPGETLSLATADAEMVGLVLRSIAFTVAAFFSVVVAAVLLFSIDVVLGLVVVIGVPLVLLLAQVVTPAISRRTEHQQATIAEATGVATDLIKGLRVLKGIGAEAVAGSRYRRLSQHARTASIASTSSYGLMTGLTAGLSGLFLAVVALIAGHRALSGEITVGELVAVVGLTQYLAEPLGMLGDISAHAARSHASARRIVTFLHTPPLVEAGGSSAGSHELTLRGVHAPGMDGLDLTSAPGEILGLAVADPTTAGSLVRLLAGELPPGAGVVALGGVPLAELTTDSRHAQLLVSPHHVDLFEGTLRSNVDPLSALDDAALQTLLEASSAVDVAALDPAGLDQPVSADASTWSGGQRQRIALARALAVDIPLLVLHDPTTAVDAVTEHRIAAGIRAMRGTGRRTTWLVTSSPALLAQADRVVLVREGRVVAEGSHHDLAHDAAYAELVLR
ncbi:ABC transporter ATP-binding protein [Nocardioides jensenii]|uniref:ABC transporter ATP-binding protein n=1 Tax=Nocardioides jensenii TaxID=1843 RepID=UPI000831410C|nr:ABC transporter ATP-binding protein [Nocardioides jensenii]